MNPFLLPSRAFGRIRHRLEIRRHSARDLIRLRRWREELEIDDAMREAMAARFTLVGDACRAGGPFANAPELRELVVRSLSRAVDYWPSGLPSLRGQIRSAARGECEAFGYLFDPAKPGGYRHDPLRDEPWPLRPHAEIRLDQPRRPGDIRMVWELARFHHLLVLGLGDLLPTKEAWGTIFRQITRRFLRENPPFDGPHWAVGMEVAIRAAAWLLAGERLALDGFRSVEDREDGLGWVDALLLHGLFIETHLERHPHGFTTNHTLSDYAGLAVLGRAFDAWPVGDRWRERAANGLAECLVEQVLAGGAHSEASLPYARYVLEASVVAALALEESKRAPLLEPIGRLASNLSEARLGMKMPAIGDGDESFFPPFAVVPLRLREPLDPYLPIEYAHALKAPIDSTNRSRGDRAGSGFLPFRSAPFTGLLVHRAAGEGFVPTHGHNDLLSICLNVGSDELLVDPGTGGYGCDRALRHELRSTAAHSTLSIEGEEQRPLRPLATFEGPSAARGGVIRDRLEPVDLEAWHEGFRDLRHTRRLREKLGMLILEDRLENAPAWGAGRAEQVVTSSVRFRLPPGIPVEQVSPRRLVIHVREHQVSLLLLRPRDGVWQIRAGAYSERYGSSVEAPIIEISFRETLPHRFRFALHAVARTREAR